MIVVAMPRTIPHARALTRPTANEFSAGGYSGHGVAMANWAGMAMAAAIRGTAERFDTWPRCRRRDCPGALPSAPLCAHWCCCGTRFTTEFSECQSLLLGDGCIGGAPRLPWCFTQRPVVRREPIRKPLVEFVEIGCSHRILIACFARTNA